MSLIAEITPNIPSNAPNNVFSDWGGLIRYTTSGHPNIPAPDLGTGVAVLSTGKDGAQGGEINIAIADVANRYILECLVSETDIVAELSDGNSVQLAAPVIDRPSPDEIWATFVTPRIVSGSWVRARISFAGTFSGEQVPAVDTWAIYKVRIIRVEM